MRRIPNIFHFYLLLLMLPQSILWALNTDIECLKKVEEIRTANLSSLFRSEAYYREASWSFRKSQQLIYGPLWEAVVRRRDRYSEIPRTSDAEILYRRYRLDADQEKKLAETKMEGAIKEIQTLKMNSISDRFCGRDPLPGGSGETISLFGNCMEIWGKETADLTSELLAVLKQYAEKELAFTAKVEDCLSDNPSDHDRFQDRFRDFFADSDIRSRVEFFSLLRKLREQYELSWPAEKCCAMCSLERRTDRDPVLSQVRLDPQGDLGAAGKVVNTARLLPAFDRLNKEREASSESEDSQKN